MKILPKIFIGIGASAAIFFAGMGVSYIQTSKAQAQFAENYELRYLNAEEQKIVNDLYEQHREHNSDFMFLDLAVKERDKYAGKKDPSEEDKRLLKAYEQMIDDYTKKLEGIPTEEEITAIADSLGVTEPDAEHIESECVTRMVKLK